MMNESNKFPSEDWKAGYKCAIDCYTFVIKELLYELSAKKKRFSQAMITDVAMIMMQHRMDVHDEYYTSAFTDAFSPFIRVRWDLSSKNVTSLEWYKPQKTNVVYNPSFRDDTCIGDDSADE